MYAETAVMPNRSRFAKLQDSELSKGLLLAESGESTTDNVAQYGRGQGPPMLTAQRNGGRTGPNPYSTLNDIVNERCDDYDPDVDNLALFTADRQHSAPKVASVLSNLVKFPMGVDPNEEALSAEDSMLALLRKAPVKLGTLMGVYLPTIQNIFGVILFLRMPWIVGVAGIGQALLIVLICCSTTMLTALSMSAIATNGVVPAGGAYFMISRALGPEFGGAVGILFYLGTTFAGAMYILGAVELLLVYMAPAMSLFGDAAPGENAMFDNLRVYGSMLLNLLAFVVFIGVKYVNRFASVCLFAVILSMLCVFIGFFATPFGSQPDVCEAGEGLLTKSAAGNCTFEYLNATLDWITNETSIAKIAGFPGLGSDVRNHNLGGSYVESGETAVGAAAEMGQLQETDHTSFAILLAIFFPSVTGIMAGSNRSGDLKDASASIPKGTIAAIATTSMVYFLSVIFLGSTVEGAVLRDKFGNSIGGKLVLAQLAWPVSYIVLIGALLSCVGAALQSLTGAPRLLQAIAQDDLLPVLAYFGKASKTGEPTRALVLTVLIAECGVLIASLDTVAPIITMFFLMCYGFINLACALQSLLRSPSWRPRYKYYHWGLSALGVLMCLILMLVSSLVYAICAIIVASLIYYYIQYKGAAKEWGDGLRGLSMQAARFSLLRLEETPPHTKNWRPQVLVLTKLNPETLTPSEPELITLAGQLKGGKGLTLVAAVLDGDYAERHFDASLGQAALKKYMNANDVDGFAQVIVGNNLKESMSYLIQGAGLGALKHNTVLCGWPHDWRRKNTASLLVHTLAVTKASGLAVMMPKLCDTTATENFDECVVLNPVAGSAMGVLTANSVSIPVPISKHANTETIDIWWILHDGGMLILIAFLLKQGKMWNKCELRIFCVAESDDNSIQMEQDLALFLRLLRIEAQVKVVEMMNTDISSTIIEKSKDVEAAVAAAKNTAPQAPSQASIRRMNTSVKLNAVIKEHSQQTTLIALNLPDFVEEQSPTEYMSLLEELTSGLPDTLFIRGGGREVITIFS
eukprot:m.656760 g.656760  ORF g.656760 m.656760 type:complete len:1031 (-) comp22706_c0_seq1:147-3239(-)